MLDFVKRLIRGMIPRSWLGRFRAWKTQRKIKTFHPYDVERTYNGRRLKVHIADPAGQDWYDKDWPTQPEISLLAQSRLKPGARVFNIGAHHGVVAMLLAAEVGPTGSVVAVEANSRNAEIVRRHANMNAMPWLTVEQAAVSDRIGTIAFNEFLCGAIDDGTGQYGRVIVPATTIDSLVAKHGLPDVVYIDIEGAEYMALTAAKSLFEANVDFFIEMHVKVGLEVFGGSVEKVLGFFPESKYRLLARDPDRDDFLPLCADDKLTEKRFWMLALAKSG